MRFILSLTALSEVSFTLNLISNLSDEYPDSKFIIVVYRDKIKNEIQKRYIGNRIEKIISQGEIGIDNNPEISPDKINKIEKKYSRSSIWNYVYQDRHLVYKRNAFLYKDKIRYSRGQLINTILKRFDIIEEIIENFKPTNLIYMTEDFGTSIAAILFEVCQYNNVNINIPLISKFSHYFSLTNDIYGLWPKLETLFLKNLNDSNFKITESTKNIYNKYLEAGKVLDVSLITVKSEKLSFSLIKRKLLTISKMFFEQFKKKDYLHFSLFSYAYDKLLVCWRRKILKNHKIFKRLDQIKSTQKFFFFPLHVEPEFVLLVQSQSYLNQLEVIKNISINLPNNFKLLVKEHPESPGRRTFDFYRKLNHLPNVEVIHHDESSINIIKKSEGVISIIGTAGLEAFLYNKLSITLSNAYYNFLPGVIKLNDFQNIAETINNYKENSNSLHQLVFIQSLMQISTEVNIIQLATKFDYYNSKIDFEKYYSFLKKYM